MHPVYFYLKGVTLRYPVKQNTYHQPYTMHVVDCKNTHTHLFATCKPLLSSLNVHGLDATLYLKKLVVLAEDNRSLKKQMALTTMFTPSTDTDSAKSQVEKLALAWCMNLCMSFKLLHDTYFKSAFSAYFSFLQPLFCI